MRGLLAGCLVFFVGPWIVSTKAADPPANSGTVPVVSSTDPAEAAKLSYISLGRPVALPAPPAAQLASQALTDSKVTPASFTPFTIGVPRSIIRAQSADFPQSMPNGLPANSGSPSPVDSMNRPVVLTQKPDVLTIMPRPVEAIDQPAPPGPYVAASPGSHVVGDATCCPEGNCPCPDECCCCWDWFGCWVPLQRLASFVIGDLDSCVNEPCRVWVDAEYLLWWTRRPTVPALVTASPPGTPQLQAGVLGFGTTSVLLGDGVPIDDQHREGARFTLGLWLDCEREIGLESTTFFLGDRNFAFSASSPGTPGSIILARPFQAFNAAMGMAVPVQSSELVAFPGLVSGTVGVTSSSSLWGTELNLRTNLCRSCCSRLDLLTGFRFLGLDENIQISENLQLSAGTTTIPENLVDIFGTHNNFYGGQLGLDWEIRRGYWSLNLLGKVAVGDTHETVIIDGSTTRTLTNPLTGMTVVQQQSGGLLTQPTNIGRFNHDRFGVVPEAGIKLGYQITPHIKFTVGYTFLYWSEVVRPGDQIDTVVNPALLAFPRGSGPFVPARPLPIQKTTDFWAQGVSLGVEVKY
jgi:hypothetical protein